ncbi:MAG: formate dehydrogenase accessory sulfurtransferase FdhD [Deltaproteobacteria bacterium]|nr:formate dehydrogenase accessory sulfurtransferase FdhD [Deltaproteobacteria bacterium]
MKKSALNAPNKEKMVAHVPCVSYSEEGFTLGTASVPKEKEIKVKVNGTELVNVLCTPEKLDSLICGYLYLEGLILKLHDLKDIKWTKDGKEVDVSIPEDTPIPKETKTIPVGLGGGAVFRREKEKIDSMFSISESELLNLIAKFNHYVESERDAKGIHTSALADPTDLLIIADDIGRHNTIDKIAGECLLQGVETKDKILLTTGRISSEMVFKAARLKVAILVTRRSPTEGAISYAKKIGITLVGRARKNSFSIFSYPEKIGFREVMSN